MIKLIHDDCIQAMQQLDEGSVDLTVTSPPYDNLRTYEGSLEWNEDIWKQVLEQLYRVTKTGGVVVWIVGDATIKGSETGTSFKQALYAKEIGFNLHDTMIWEKPNPIPTQHTRYQQSFEYMFVLSKGKNKQFNPIRIDTKCNGVKVKKHRAKVNGHQYNEDGFYTVSKDKIKANIWKISNVKNKSKHKAVFPQQLAVDHIISWSNEGDTVLDPFMGSGTAGIACKDLNRNFIGIEKVEKYFQIASDRIHSHNNE